LRCRGVKERKALGEGTRGQVLEASKGGGGTRKINDTLKEVIKFYECEELEGQEGRSIDDLTETHFAARKQKKNRPEDT